MLNSRPFESAANLETSWHANVHDESIEMHNIPESVSYQQEVRNSSQVSHRTIVTLNQYDSFI